MHEQQRQRAAQLLDESGIEWALFSDIDSVRWLTGLNLPAPALVWFDRGSFTLLADEGYAVVAAAFGDNSNCAHVSYVGYTIQQPIDAPGRLAEALNELVGGSGTTAAPVGIEEKSLLWALWQTLQKALPGCEPASLEGKLVPLRAVKTEEELARIREGKKRARFPGASGYDWPRRRPQGRQVGAARDRRLDRGADCGGAGGGQVDADGQ